MTREVREPPPLMHEVRPGHSSTEDDDQGPATGGGALERRARAEGNAGQQSTRRARGQMEVSRSVWVMYDNCYRAL